MRNKFPIYGRGKELPRVRTEFGITEKSKTGIKAPSFAVTHKTLPDGTRVKLTTIGQFASHATVPAGSPMQPSLRKAQITLAVGGAIQRCSFLSGLADWLNWNTYASDGYFSRVAFAAASNSWVDSEDMLGTLGEGVDTAPCAIVRKFPNSLTVKKSSAYTGLMRKVVQILGGKDKPIPYNHCYSNTDGIFVASDGQHWVIRIDNTSGVFTQRVPRCETLTDKRKAELGIDLDYIPSSTLGSWTQIAPASMLASYASKQPMYLECGWAFSYNGSEAQNIVWGWSSSEVPRWKKVYRFKLVISEINKRPTAAFVTLEDEQSIYWGMEGGIKYPHYIPESLGGGQSLFTFDSNPDPIITGPPVDLESRQPIFVYYIEGHDNDPVIVYNDTTGTPDNEVVSTVPPAPYCSGSATWQYETSPGSAAGVYGNFTKYFSGSRIYVLDGPVAAPENPKPKYEADGVISQLVSTQVEGWNLGQEIPGTSNYAFTQAWRCTHTRANGGADYVNGHAALIPFGDREQIYLYYKEYETTHVAPSSPFISGWVYGDKYALSSVKTWQEIPECIPEPETAWWKSTSCDVQAVLTPVPLTSYGTAINDGLTTDPYFCTIDECAAEGNSTYFFTRLGGSVSTHGCLGRIATQPGYTNTVLERQALYAYNAITGLMEQVKEWDEWEPLDGYTAIHDSLLTGSQILVSNPDAFTNKSFLSLEMNGTDGETYKFFGNPNSVYPIEALGNGLDRCWFGKPF